MVQLFDFLSCEIDVYQREIQNFMIMTSKRIVERDTISLANAFEINGKRLEVLVGVNHQFACTLDTTEDKRNHLDIVNRMAPVQKMLTMMKNRMLSIKTLTGGDGLIIRSKDLQDILNEFARNIIKSDELKMRTRTEQLSYIIERLTDLLYAKDQQLYTMEHKL